MEQNSDAAQLETIKNLCTGENCEIDPKVLFTEAVCPGTFCIFQKKIIDLMLNVHVQCPKSICLILLENRKTWV